MNPEYATRQGFRGVSDSAMDGDIGFGEGVGCD
jgi:hypothetical protein